MSRVVDLDAALGGGLTVELKGVQYELPGDIPVPTMLTFLSMENRLEELSGEEGDEVYEILQEMYDELLELFQEKQPDLERLPIGMKQVPILIREVQSIYNDEKPAGGDADPPPRTRSRRSSGRSASAKKPGKKSSRS